MAEIPKHLSTQELLERIVALEAENSKLKARVNDVQEGLDIFMAATESEFAHVNDALWPVVHKIFPQFSEMKSRIDAVVPPRCVDPRADRRRDKNTS